MSTHPVIYEKMEELATKCIVAERAANALGLLLDVSDEHVFYQSDLDTMQFLNERVEQGRAAWEAIEKIIEQAGPEGIEILPDPEQYPFLAQLIKSIKFQYVIPNPEYPAEPMGVS